MRTLLALCGLSLLTPSMSQAQVQFVPYNPVLPPFRSISFSRDILPPLVVNPAPANQVFVVVDAYDLLAARSLTSTVAPSYGDLRTTFNPTLSSVVSPFAINQNIVPASLPVVADTNYAVNAAIASVMPAALLPTRNVAPTATPAAETRAPITLASIKPKNAGANDPRYPGWFVLAEEDLQDRMRLTPAQKVEIEKATSEKNAVAQPAVINSDDKGSQFMTQRRASRERFLQMLSTEQQRMWTDLTGDPYEFRPNW